MWTWPNTRYETHPWHAKPLDGEHRTFSKKSAAKKYMEATPPTRIRTMDEKTICREFTKWALHEGIDAGFLTWAAWMSTTAPVGVQEWIDRQYPEGGNGEFFQRFLA